MEKMKRTERLVAITQFLMNMPNALIPLTVLSDHFGAAKSTISEDLVVLKGIFASTGRGRLETIHGAAGGVRYIPGIKVDEAERYLAELALRLSVKERILPGGFLYMTDILSNPADLRLLGLLFAEAFRTRRPDVVVTVETKGIPLALATAQALGIPMTVVRHGNKVTEGSSVSINYISGSDRRIQTMSLSRRSLISGQRAIIIDDFLKAGGTVRGITNLMGEFGVEVVGAGVLMEADVDQGPKLVDGCLALLRLVELDYLTRTTRVAANEILGLIGNRGIE